MNTDLLNAAHLLSLGARTKPTPKPKAPHADANTRRRAELPNWNFEHLARSPDQLDQDCRPTARDRRRIDCAWDIAFARMRTGRPQVSTKTVDRRWDQAFARSRGTR
ncbi:hypothetical protein AWB68_07451 [Caballeronia choica]|uniref:Uncharacterized protein n=1 Tax=Caballeronia choica TaxID=326476 RepID=A0A158KVS7_9BURK|nr:hypothetical protein AWB68_07451 [Caballeronia choica]